MSNLYCHTFSYILGYLISENPEPSGSYIVEYELKKESETFLDTTTEYLELYKETLKKRFESYTEFLKAYDGELYSAEKLNLQYIVKIENMIDFLKTSELQLTGDIPHLVYYYYMVDYSLVLDLLETYRAVVEHIVKYLKTFNLNIDPKDYYKLDFDNEINNFNKTETLLRKHNDIFNIKKFDLESILNDVFREK
jgi:hypothetical protein